MEASESLLVALMFITILTLGIANILTSLAVMLEGSGDTRAGDAFDWLHTSWVLIMLLAHFNFFWHTLDILGKQAWEFEGFLFTITGPILMFFATQVVIGSSPLPEGVTLREHYFAAAKRFFSLFALIQIWVICSDLLLERGLTGAAIVNVICLIIAMTLIALSNVRAHFAGTMCAWVVYLGATALRGSELIN
jgi:hypothetical protein